MWTFTIDGFFSVVQDTAEPDQVWVRSRSKEDLEALIVRLQAITGSRHKPAIIEYDKADYAFRIKIQRSSWAGYIAFMAQRIDYPNFKTAAIPKGDHLRSSVYHRIWAELVSWQEKLVHPWKQPDLFTSSFLTRKDEEDALEKAFRTADELDWRD